MRRRRYRFPSGGGAVSSPIDRRSANLARSGRHRHAADADGSSGPGGAAVRVCILLGHLRGQPRAGQARGAASKPALALRGQQADR